MKALNLFLVSTIIILFSLPSSVLAQRRRIESLTPVTGSDYIFGLKVYPLGLLSGKIGGQLEFMTDSRRAIAVDVSHRKLSLTDGLFSKVASPYLDSLNLGTGNFSSLQISPSFRLYAGKGGPGGFYFATALRYVSAKMEVSPQIEDFSDVSAQMSTTMFGLNLDIGIQALLAERISIDWNILGLGAQYGGVDVLVSAPGISSSDASQIADELNTRVENIPMLDMLFRADGSDISAYAPVLVPVLRSRLSLGVFF